MVRLSKSGVVLVVVFALILLGATGYLVWRTSIPENIAPIDTSAGDVPPDSQASCKGCRSNGREWYWVNGQCSDRASSSCIVENQPVTQKKCQGNSHIDCAYKNPGTACGNGGGCVVYDPNDTHSCRCGGEKSSDPTPVANVCDGGSLISPAGSYTSTIGEPITISGTANDSNGVNANQVLVTVDGTQVGVAKVENIGGSNKSVNWSYDFTPTSESQVVTVSWKDLKGVGGPACTKQVTITSGQKDLTSANWSIDVLGGGNGGSGLLCEMENGEAASVRLDYTVRVNNTGDAQGTLATVRIELDDSLNSTNVITESLSPAGSISDGSVTWSLTGGDAVYSVGQVKEYKFSLRVPKSLYGLIKNEVVVVPVGDDQKEVRKVFESNASCLDDGKVPETGVFDSVRGQVISAFVLIALGIVYLRGYEKGLVMMVGEGYAKTSKIYHRNFGNKVRVAKSRSKFEKRLK